MRRPGSAPPHAAQPGFPDASEIRALLVSWGGRAGRLVPDGRMLMLARQADAPFSGKGWLFELKYDGYRVLASKDRGVVRLSSRRDNDLTGAYPEVAAALGALPYEAFVLDGEVAVLDAAGRPSFQLMQRRAMLTRPADLARVVRELPVVFHAFDLLAFGDVDVRTLPLHARKDALRRVLPAGLLPAALRFADHVEERGEDLFREVLRLELEGVIAKRADAPYEAGRSSNWLKICHERRADLVVIGFSPPEGTRAGFGALHLGAFREGALVYVGRVGSGFTDRQLQELRRALEPGARREPPCALPALIPRGSLWVPPRLVCEVRFKEVTADGLLRAPVFLRVRDDKAPEDCAPPPPRGERP
jgi:bifunctional non-homologous end joining protein LigD